MLYSFIYLANDFVETSPRPKILRYVCFSSRNRCRSLACIISFRPQVHSKLCINHRDGAHVKPFCALLPAFNARVVVNSYTQI